MKLLKTFCIVALAIALSSVPAFSLASAHSSKGEGTVAQQQAQSGNSALERGYRTGYSDGYQAGFSDSASQAPRDYTSKDEYQRADRAYAPAYGTLDDYRDGYRQGFEIGYSAGYERRGFDSTVPGNLSRRGIADTQNDNNNAGPVNTNGPSSADNNNTANSNINRGGQLTIPADTTLRVELLNSLSSDASQRGDTFQARVLEPQEFEGAIIDGHISRVKRAGKVKGNSELQLSFDQIRLPDNRQANFSAQVIEVMASGSAGVRDVDPEGGVRGKDKTKDDVSTVGASTGIGAIIGAIAGGGKGAAIGAAIGGAVGAGRVLTSSGGDIKLPRGQQLRIRTANDTRIQ